MATSTWRIITPTGDAHEHKRTYPNDVAAVLAHHRILTGLNPPPGEASPGAYIYDALTINGIVITCSWHIIDAHGDLQRTTVTDMIAALTSQLDTELQQLLA